MFLIQPNNRKSEMPVAAAALSFPGCAFASATAWSTELIFIDAGTETASTTSEMLTIGSRSLRVLEVVRQRVVIVGATVKMPAGPNHSV